MYYILKKSSKGTTRHLHHQTHCRLARGENAHTRALGRAHQQQLDDAFLLENTEQQSSSDIPARINVWCWYCMDDFRRPEGKFKKKQTPRDEALYILKPQMDNPPAPQVDTNTWTF